MHVLRGVFALSLCVSLCAYNFQVYAGGKPLGVLTLAYGAHLNASNAFAGLSVFDGESLSTDAGGKLSARIGGSVITLIEQSAATLQRNGDGAHVDLEAGSVYSLVGGEQSAGGARGRRAVAGTWCTTGAGADSDVCAEDFADYDATRESRFFIREGISRFAGGPDVPHLEDGPRNATDVSNDQRKAGMSTGTNVAYFILAGAGAGLAAWGIHNEVMTKNELKN